ncbi:MAG TPA: hypothetical protein PLH15_05555 [Spirochaetota bacterium]|nr:hypothetical protein [Spirochaetota bacterium]HQO23881.1 hypothetical protein [Spirochaetota bacterium]HQQ23287.1 hypothetical protein [Spirochaetota bacterium]
MKKYLIGLLLFSGLIYSGDTASTIILTGSWNIQSSDMVIFTGTGKILEKDPLPAGQTEIVFKKDFTGILNIETSAVPFKWTLENDNLKIQIGDKTYQFTIRSIDANKVLIIQTFSPKPEVSVIAVVQKSKKP